MYKHQTFFFFLTISPFGIAPVQKEHTRPGHAGIADHYADLSIPELKKKV